MAHYEDWGGWPRYVPVAERRRNAEREAKKLAKRGRTLSPIELDGRKIASTWWGQAWCRNLESYSDYSNRLPRGRSYARNGSVLDLRIAPGKVTSLVAGTQLYTVEISIHSLAEKRWRALIRQCAGKIGSLVDLLQGKLSKAVLEILAQPDRGLFPAPEEISLGCSCPDWADMCKHVAATLYGVGARLDHQPDLFFVLRKVDQMELVVGASATRLMGKAPRGKKVLAAESLPDVFGIEMDASSLAAPKDPRPRKNYRAGTSKRRAAAKPFASAAKRSRRR